MSHLPKSRTVRCEACRARHKKCGHGPLPKHLVIPDVQAKPGVPLDHLDWLGQYIRDKQPDRIICIGDFWDMPSLSSYDKGKRSYEGRRYKADIEAGREGMERLMEPFAGDANYRPGLDFFLGNHEDRITRAINDDPKLEGTLSLKDLGLEEMGWTVHPFLRPATIDGVTYAHYFTSGLLGRPVTSARALFNSEHKPCIMGHNQTTQIHVDPKTQGMAIFCGIYYQHDEEYLGPQGNNTRRQLLMLHEAKNGLFDPMFVSMDYLKRKYS